MNRSKRIKSYRSLVLRDHNILPPANPPPSYLFSVSVSNGKVGIKIPKPRPPLKAMMLRRQKGDEDRNRHIRKWGRPKILFAKGVTSVMSTLFGNKKSHRDRHTCSSNSVATSTIDGDSGSEIGFSDLEDKKDGGDGGLELCKLRILMGLKCRPLNRSGILRYDENGVLVPEIDP